MSKTSDFDVVIVGGGPAGMSAAAWCAELGLHAVLVERERDIGGQLSKIYNPIENYLGCRAENGQEMLAHFRRSFERFDLARVLCREVVAIDPDSRSVQLDDSGVIRYRCLIIATGVRRRSLGLPGELEFHGKGILESGARDRALVAGKRVVIVGGGDAAAENALILADFAETVTVVHRRGRMTARREFLLEIEKRDNVELMLDTVVSAIRGDSKLTGVDVRDNSHGNARTLQVDTMLIRIGVEPNSEIVDGIVDLDADGYVVVNASGETSVDGVFAIGDVANPISPALQTAAGTGATAVRAVFSLINPR